MRKTLLLLVISVTFFACNDSKKDEKTISSEEKTESKPLENATTAEKIAYANGYDNWKNVFEINFTFNVDRGEQHFERSWTWKPNEDMVKMISQKDTVTYNRSKVDSTTQKADAAFINDKFWLLAPFNLVWDTGTTFSEKKNVIAPISKDTLNQLTVVYGNDGGYTPGDAYDFFYDENHKIKEWNFRKGNDSVPTMTTTWEKYENHKGLEIATTHKDSTGVFKLYFSNISVKN